MMKTYNLSLDFYELLELKNQMRRGISYCGVLLKREQPEYIKEMIKEDLKKYALLYKKVYKKVEKI